MACDATARLYDVDEKSVVFKRLTTTNKYDQGTVTFRARKGALIDLDKLHESIWATRLSGRTSSGVVKLEVTTVGEVVRKSDETVLRVTGSDAEFILRKHADDQSAKAFDKLVALAGSGNLVRLSGQIEGYVGRWPKVLGKKPPSPRRILVTSFELEE